MCCRAGGSTGDASADCWWHLIAKFSPLDTNGSPVLFPLQPAILSQSNTVMQSCERTALCTVPSNKTLSADQVVWDRCSSWGCSLQILWESAAGFLVSVLCTDWSGWAGGKMLLGTLHLPTGHKGWDAMGSAHFHQL